MAAYIREDVTKDNISLGSSGLMDLCMSLLAL